VNGWSAVCIFLGAGFGALLRWVLGLTLDPIFPPVPLGTLAANVIGGLLMGLALGLFTEYENLSPFLRLAVTTGFLGGLTTFSTFSGEVVNRLLRHEYALVCVIIVVHVGGALFATLTGISITRWLFKP